MVPAKNRLKKDKEIKLLFEKSRGVFGRCLGVRLRLNHLAETRFVFITGLKVSKSAVVRNLLRRQMREAIRKHLEEIKRGFDVALVAKKEMIGAKFAVIEDDVLKTLEKANLIK